jgi:hypothetical protein
MQVPSGKVVHVLNSLLRTERAAIESLELAEEGLRRTTLREPLATCKRDHRRRIHWLWRRIMDLGGHPANGSGPWGAVTRIIEHGAVRLGDTPAIAALEDFAHHDIERYRSAIPQVDLDTADFIEHKLLPGQEQTYQVLRALHQELIERSDKTPKA